MKVEVIRTKKLLPPKDDLYVAIRQSIKNLPERSVVVVTSKIVAIHQGRCVKIRPGVDRARSRFVY